MNKIAEMINDAPVRRPVAFYRCDADADVHGHDLRTRLDVSRSIAALMDVGFAGQRSAGEVTGEELYWVPSKTLTTAQSAALGIVGEGDFFGGVVPYPFVATKVITHPLMNRHAVAPEGWNHSLGDALADVVLPGYSVFTLDDAHLAGRRMLDEGPIRLKVPSGIGGNGQVVVASDDALSQALSAIDASTIEREGLVVERDLATVATYSVGEATVGPWKASYVGTQRLTRNRGGTQVYGGSDLIVLRGTFDQLLSLRLTDPMRLAVTQALSYHDAAMNGFPGLVASRCNYDVAQGTDHSGRALSGVLEQSWRIGGASGAELAALHAFRRDASLDVIEASTHEVYSDDFVAPPDAELHYDDVDPRVGRLVKYAQVRPHADA